MESARAFAPGNVSCVFQIIPNPDPARMHSLGMGFTVDDGVTATVSRQKAAGTAATSIVFNGRPVRFPTVEMVIGDLVPDAIRVDLETRLPISSGFGISGASALAVALALNQEFGLGLTREEVGMKAHVAEVRNLTGLGDVCGQWNGGCLVKLKAGSPLAAQRLPVAEGAVYYRYFSAIHTRDIIGNEAMKQKINAAAEGALTDYAAMLGKSSVTLAECANVALRFAEESTLLRDPQVRELIDRQLAAGHAASMIMLGNAVFSDHPFDGCSQTRLAMRSAELLS